VRQRALEISSRFGSGILEMSRALLRDDLLRSVARKPDHPAAGVCGPERPIPLGQNALWPLKIMADVLDGALVDAKIEDGIGLHRVGCGVGSRRRNATRLHHGLQG